MEQQQPITLEMLAAQVQETNVKVDQLIEDNKVIHARVDAVTVRLDQVTEDLRANNVKLDMLIEQMSALTHHVVDLTRRVDKLEQVQHSLIQSQQEMRQVLSAVRANQEASNARMDAIETMLRDFILEVRENKKSQGAQP